MLNVSLSSSSIAVAALASVFMPSAPSAPTAAAWDWTAVALDAAEVSVAAAPEDGGAAIKGYECRLSSDGAAWGDAIALADGAALGARTIGVREGVTHAQLRAVNAVGAGDWAATKKIDTAVFASPPALAPSAPTAEAWSWTAVALDAAEVSVAAAPEDGGAVIEGYECRLSSDGVTWGAATALADGAALGARTISVIEGVTYAQVRAVNAVGAGDWAAAKQIDTTTEASEISALTVAAQDWAQDVEITPLAASDLFALEPEAEIVSIRMAPGSDALPEGMTLPADPDFSGDPEILAGTPTAPVWAERTVRLLATTATGQSATAEIPYLVEAGSTFLFGSTMTIQPIITNDNAAATWQSANNRWRMLRSGGTVGAFRVILGTEVGREYRLNALATRGSAVGGLMHVFVQSSSGVDIIPRAEGLSGANTAEGDLTFTATTMATRIVVECRDYTSFGDFFLNALTLTPITPPAALTGAPTITMSASVRVDDAAAVAEFLSGANVETWSLSPDSQPLPMGLALAGREIVGFMAPSPYAAAPTMLAAVPWVMQQGGPVATLDLSEFDATNWRYAIEELRVPLTVGLRARNSLGDVADQEVVVEARAASEIAEASDADAVQIDGDTLLVAPGDVLPGQRTLTLFADGPSGVVALPVELDVSPFHPNMLFEDASVIGLIHEPKLYSGRAIDANGDILTFFGTSRFVQSFWTAPENRSAGLTDATAGFERWPNGHNSRFVREVKSGEDFFEMEGRVARMTSSQTLDSGVGYYFSMPVRNNSTSTAFLFASNPNSTAADWALGLQMVSGDQQPRVFLPKVGGGTDDYSFSELRWPRSDQWVTLSFALTPPLIDYEGEDPEPGAPVFENAPPTRLAVTLDGVTQEFTLSAPPPALSMSGFGRMTIGGQRRLDTPSDVITGGYGAAMAVFSGQVTPEFDLLNHIWMRDQVLPPPGFIRQFGTTPAVTPSEAPVGGSVRVRTGVWLPLEATKTVKGYMNGAEVTLGGNAHTPTAEGQFIGEVEVTNDGMTPNGYFVGSAWIGAKPEKSGDDPAHTITAPRYEHEGVLLEFDAPRAVGHYARGHTGPGDVFVVGPTKLRYKPGTQITSEGRRIHGAMLNMIPQQRYYGGNLIVEEARGFRSMRDGLAYSNLQNAAITGRNGQPLAVPGEIDLLPGDSLVISVSDPFTRQASANKTTRVTDYFIIVTCVAETPYHDEFRPPLMWPRADLANKPRYRLSDVDWSKLPGLDRSGISFPNVDSMADLFRYVTIDHQTGPSFYDMATIRGINTYGRTLMAAVDSAFGYILTDAPLASRQRVATGILQYGIDIWGALHAKEDRTNRRRVWNADGGHNDGRLQWLLVAGALFNDAGMLSPYGSGPGKQGKSTWQATRYSYYVTQEMVDFQADPGWVPTFSDRFPHQRHEAGMLGDYPMPIVNPSAPLNANYAWTHKYLFQTNGDQVFGPLLGLLTIPGAREGLDHDVYLHGRVRYWEMRNGREDPWRTLGGTVAPRYPQVANRSTRSHTRPSERMWDRHYRDFYQFPWEE